MRHDIYSWEESSVGCIAVLAMWFLVLLVNFALLAATVWIIVILLRALDVIA